MAILLPGYDQVRGNTPANTPYRVASAPWRIVLHTVEGDPRSIDSMRSIAAQHKYGPHLWVSPRLGAKIQTVPLDMSARALLHPSGTIETNHMKAVQVEQFGFASQTQDWSDTWVDWVGEYVIAEICRAISGINLDYVERTYGAGDGIILATSSSPIRHSESVWRNCNWVTTHQRIPCVTLDTKILLSDYTWKAAGDIEVGDEVIGFDETPNGRGDRHFGLADVTAYSQSKKECLEITTDRGHKIKTTKDHLWLARIPAGKKWPGNTKWGWVEASDLVEGSEVALYAEPWNVNTSWEAGWLAGMFDADGWLTNSNREEKGVFYTLGIGQRESKTKDRVVASLETMGFEVNPLLRKDREESWNVQPFYDIRVLGGKQEVMRALGSIRPPRLLDLDAPIWAGSVNRTVKRVSITSIQNIGEQDIASITTESNTLIGDGYLMHNCNDHWDCGRFKLERALAAARETLSPSQPVEPPPPPPPTEEEILMSAAEHINNHTNGVGDSVVDRLTGEVQRNSLGTLSFMMNNQKTGVIFRKEGTGAPWYGMMGGRVFGPLDFETAKQFKALNEITENSATVADPLFTILTKDAEVVLADKSVEDIVNGVSETNQEFLNGLPGNTDELAQKIAQQVVVQLGPDNATSEILNTIADALKQAANQ